MTANAMASTATIPYKIVYCSRNSLGDPAQSAGEIRKILALSRVNNKRLSVTGALLFNSGCFAQVLEGEPEAVQGIYERIACDPRHRSITMLQAGYDGPRDFSEWAMAYAGSLAEDEFPLLVSTLDAAFAGPASNGDAILGLLRGVILHESGKA